MKKNWEKYEFFKKMSWKFGFSFLYKFLEYFRFFLGFKFFMVITYRFEMDKIWNIIFLNSKYMLKTQNFKVWSFFKDDFQIKFRNPIFINQKQRKNK